MPKRKNRGKNILFTTRSVLGGLRLYSTYPNHSKYSSLHQDTYSTSSYILTTILSSKLLARIIYTPNLLFHISRCEMIISRISHNNIVKQFFF